MRPGQAGNYNAISMTYVFAVLFRPARHLATNRAGGSRYTATR
jgi:hypothetical protein